MNPLSISYDPETDIVTIEGKQYAGEMFRTFSLGTAEDELIAIEPKDGVVQATSYRGYSEIGGFLYFLAAKASK